MFRGPQILTWSCPIRSLLLLRESHLSAVAEQTSAGWQGAKRVKEWRYEEINGRGSSKNGSSLSTGTACCSAQLSSFSSDCDEYQLRRDSFENLPSKAIVLSHHHNHQASAAAKSKQTSDCLINMTCPQRWRRPWDFCRPLLRYTNKTPCNPPQGHLQHRQHFVRAFDLPSSTSWNLSHFHTRPQPPCQPFHQTRGIHQAAPRVADTWRDCLSSENENRCRQSLGPNLKLYEAERGRKGASQSSGKNQGRWASILVCLCSVEGEPSFLFTLRSSTLKGRHKGDVSFAGGKSDPSDRDVVATALREAQEELGVNVATERVWGVLKPHRDASGMLIAPVLANLGPLEKLTLKPNPGEVEEIFTLSLSHVCNPQNRGYTHFRTGDKYGYTLPVFRNGKHRVWGLTAVALENTLKVIVPP
ncbi:mitochondrial coenzyme A diphosphatase NUDT8 [Stegastes partitus]|uniref:Nucleoside diphosphate-linked moiety X motif 8, mitochondrial n=1 Tax=Stegastes partitus TaxID=144197 RepID=A0A3B5AC60_9TELE|nr:PREDICTED: nucleoside diphosphate-linked moiety X motif 8, mitochondrial [Stegastes partitus]